MPYRVKPDGSIEVDTLEEAIALSKRLANGTSNGSASTTPTANWKTLRPVLGGNQLKLLAALKAHDGPLTLAQLRDTVGAKDNMALSGMISAIVRNARKCGLESKQVLIRKVEMGSDIPIISYRAGPLLKEAEL
jgi:hypothetical protein